MRSLLLVLFVLLVAMPGWAANWSSRQMEPGQRSTYDWSDSADDPSTALDASRCAQTSWQFSDDVTSNGDTTAAATLYHCEDPSGAVAGALCTSIYSFVGSTTAPIIFDLRPGYYKLDVTAATAAGSTARVTSYCTQEYAGPQAPGMVGSFATAETLSWIRNLEEVPFPDKIDNGQWTDLYFSFDNNGAWPAGNNANDGLTPATAKQTIGAAGASGANSVCLGLDPGATVGRTGGFVRCNFDVGDDWSFATGGATNLWGEILDAGVDTTGCPDTYEGARAQPCFWLRAVGPGRIHFDYTGNVVNAPCMQWETITKKMHVLIEKIDMTCQNGGTDKAVWDTQEAAILTVVAGDGVSVGATSSAQVASAHDYSVTHLYGNIDLSYAPPGATVAATTIGANGAGAYSVHIGKPILGNDEAPPGPGDASDVLDLNQGSGASDASLIPLTSTQPAVAWVSGVLRSGTTQNASNSQLIELSPDCEDGAAPDSCATIELSNHVQMWVTDAYLDLRNARADPVYVEFVYELANRTATGDGRIDLTMMDVSFSDTAAETAYRHFVCGLVGGVLANDQLHLNVVNAIFEGVGVNEQILRLQCADLGGNHYLADNGLSTIFFRHYTYIPQATQWRIHSLATGDCNSNDAEALETCDPGNMFTNGLLKVFAGRNSVQVAVDQLLGEGFCDTLTPQSCANLVANQGWYTTTVDDRLAIPAFIAGRKASGYLGRPDLYPHGGRPL